MIRLASKHSTAIEAIVVALLALAIYLPFLAIQYDTNGVIEAAALESGQLVNKNHMLYRPAGLLVLRVLEMLGYHGNSLYVLQALNALCGAIGAGLAYALFKSSTRDRAAAVLGCFWLATSFVYWIFSTDAAYITLAGTLALGAMVCVAYSKSSAAFVASGVLLSLSILTWQAGIFLVPTALMFMIAGAKRPVFRDVALLLVTIGLIAGSAYLLAAYTLSDARTPTTLWSWFTNYSEGPALPLWGVWSAGRIDTAAVSALRSIVPVLLAIRPSAITRSVQLGRIAVDIALMALTALLILAALKTRRQSLLYLLGYALFIPFIVWWDPFEPKWFLIPNIFLAGFLSCGLQPWLRRKSTAVGVVFCALAIAGTNFVTTIRPRHTQIGTDRSIAQCVADHMKNTDVFIAAEWGWPDYLEYLHSLKALNLINAGGAGERIARAQGVIASAHRSGGDAYLADPRSHSESHLEWLRVQTGLTLDDLLAFGGSPSFNCSDRTILKLPSATGN